MPKLSGIMGYGQLSTSLIETPSPSTSVMSRLVNKCPLMTAILSCLGWESPFSFRPKPVCPLHQTHPMLHPPTHFGPYRVIRHRLPLNNHSRTSHMFLSRRSQTIRRQKSNHLIKTIRKRIYRRWLFLNSLCKIISPWLLNNPCKIIHKDIYQRWLLLRHPQCNGRTHPCHLYNPCHPWILNAHPKACSNLARAVQ